MTLAIYPGSFDPVTHGHVDVARRARALFDEVVVAVAHNPRKTALFTLQERQAMFEEALEGCPGIRVSAFEDLVVDFARREGATVIVKGLRGVSDFETEVQMAQLNRHLAPEVDTVFLATSSHVAYVSSSFVREIARLGGDVDGLVPAHVGRLLARRLGRTTAGPSGHGLEPVPGVASSSTEGGQAGS